MKPSHSLKSFLYDHNNDKKQIFLAVLLTIIIFVLIFQSEYLADRTMLIVLSYLLVVPFVSVTFFNIASIITIGALIVYLNYDYFISVLGLEEDYRNVEVLKNLEVPLLLKESVVQNSTEGMGVDKSDGSGIYGGSVALGAPMIYTQQLYPKIPYNSDEGRVCKFGCGAVGDCVDGVCRLKPYDATVMNIPV